MGAEAWIALGALSLTVVTIGGGMAVKHGAMTRRLDEHSDDIKQLQRDQAAHASSLDKLSTDIGWIRQRLDELVGYFRNGNK